MFSAWALLIINFNVTKSPTVCVSPKSAPGKHVLDSQRSQYSYPIV